MNNRWGFVPLLLIFALPVPAQTITVSGGIDNAVYDKAPNQISGTPPFYIIADAGFENSFAGMFRYSFRFQRNALFDYLFSVGLMLDMNIVDIGLGSFLESKDLMFEAVDAGMSIRFGVKFPDIMFFSFILSQSLSAYNESPGNRTVRSLDAELGFWLRNMLASANIEQEEITIIDDSASLKKTISRTKAFVRFIIFGKNVPFLLRLDGGAMINTADYQIMSGGTDSPLKDEAFAVYGGLGLNFDIGRNLVWYINSEIPARLSGILSGFMFHAETGFKILLRPE